MRKPRTERAGAGVLRPCSWLLALTLTLLMALAGCASASPTGRTTAPTQPTSSPTALPIFEQTPLTMQQAWGNVTVRTLPEVLGANHFFVFDNAVTPDGQSLIGVKEPCNFGPTTSLPSYLALDNIATGQITILTLLQTPQSQVISASADEDWIVWVEADDQPSFFDWTLFAYNRHSGQVERLGQAVKDANGQPVPGPFSGPVVDHDEVIWGQPIGSVKQSLSNAVVRMENLTTGAVTTLATRAGNVGLSWPWATWSQATSSGTGYQEFRNLLTGQTAQLDEQTNYVALAGTTAAYVVNDSTLFLLNDITRSADTSTAQTLWVAPGADYIDFPTMNDRLIGWNQNSAAVVYDRQLQKIITLPTPYTQYSASTVDHHLLVWGDGLPPDGQQQAKQMCPGQSPGVLKIVDTSTLPTHLGG